MIFNFLKKNSGNTEKESSVFDNYRPERPANGKLMVPLKLLNIDENKKTVDVTVIINVWKRPHIEEQLFHLLTQTVFPREIWILYYENHVQADEIIKTYQQVFPFIHLIRSDKNLKYFGRFTIAVNTTTTYTWLMDDDVIPGEEWLANCVEKCTGLNSVITCTGRIIPKNDFKPEKWKMGGRYKHFIGDEVNGGSMNLCDEDTQVDYGCNSYFMKSEWLQAYWSIWPATFGSGEDIHLSATCKVQLDVNTYVLKQDNIHNSGNIKRSYGWDHNASWKQKNFIDIREKVLRYHIEQNNWAPLLWK